MEEVDEPTDSQKVRGRTQSCQMALLVEIMENQVTLATGKSDGTNYARMHQGEWEKVAHELNKMGPPMKDWRGWRIVWNDFTSEVRKKLRLEEKNRNQTGGGPMRRSQMTELQSRVSNFMQLRAAISGRKGYKFGAKGMKMNPEHLSDLPAQPPSQLPVAGPSAPAAGPSAPAAELSAPAAELSASAAGPSASAAGPSAPAAEPSAPAAGPSAPAAGPSAPAAGPSAPAAGPSPPDVGPSTQQPAVGPSTHQHSKSKRRPRPPPRRPHTSSEEHRRYRTNRGPLVELFDNRFDAVDAKIDDLVSIQRERLEIEKQRFELDQQNTKMYKERLEFMRAFSRGLSHPDDLDF